MRKQIAFEEAKGRTIEGFVFSNLNGQMIMTLSGDAFVCFGVDKGYEPGEESVQSKQLEWTEFGDQLIVGGVWSDLDHYDFMRQRRITLETMRERSERETYERLKAKFEGGPDARHP